MKHQIKHRYTDAVLFECELPDDTPSGMVGRLCLEKAIASGAHIRGSDLIRGKLSRADLSGADLSGANLRGANLIGANLRRADLRCADLSGADLSGANLIGVSLRGAVNTPPVPPTPTATQQLAELYCASDAAALRAQINAQDLPGGPF